MAGQSVGFVGVGRMGSPMVRRLVEAGFEVTAFDTSEETLRPLLEKGVRRGEGAKHVASSADIVIASLPTPPVVEMVALGPGGIAEGTRAKIFVDVSTTGSSMAKHVARRLAEKGITAVDAPVSGGVSGAEKGTLAVMVSCPQDVFDQVEPVLSHIGKLFHVGTEPGQGQTMKLINNLLSATAMAISSEAMAMAVKAGLDAKMAVDVINAGSGRNTATMDKIPRCVLPRTFDFGFALALIDKDVRLCLQEADALRVPMVVGSAVRQLLSIASASEAADADMTEIMRTVERWAGITVGSK